MNVPTRRTVLLYLTATFIVGAVAGSAIGYSYGRRPVFRPFDREEMRQKLCDSFTHELDLTPGQRSQLDPILRQGMGEFEAAQQEHGRRIGELIKQGDARITAILTPEQQAKFKVLQQEKARKHRERDGRPGGPPPPSDGQDSKPESGSTNR